MDTRFAGDEWGERANGEWPGMGGHVHRESVCMKTVAHRFDARVQISRTMGARAEDVFTAGSWR